jgi:NADH:ubiquinone reductase (H+-translocating)
VPDRHRVVIVGAGFGGLYAALSLGRAKIDLTVIDRRNFHLFQPLLYQVATGGLSPGDISSPIRAVLRHQKNARVLLGEVTSIDADRRFVRLADGEEVPYDTLVLATGASHDYFGHDDWRIHAPGLKTIEDATDIRRRIFLAFEAAERESDADTRAALLNFVVVGGGPTGVELAGALGEIAHDTLKHDFRTIDPKSAQILLVEGNDRVLTAYPPKLSVRAEKSLARLGVTVVKSTLVVGVDEFGVTVKDRDRTQRIHTRTVLWAAGVQASPLARSLADGAKMRLERAGQITVEPDLTVPGHPEIIVLGDLAVFRHQTGDPLPGVAPVAMQEGRYAAKLIMARLSGKKIPPFKYFDKGTMATIGRASAVAVIGPVKLWGYPAWLAWLFIHLMYLVEFENRLLVFIQWAWNYLTFNRGARLITGEPRLPDHTSSAVPTVSDRTSMKQ